METVSQSTQCSACGEPLSLNHVGPCTKCGGTRKKHRVIIRETAHIHDSFSWRHTHEYYERHKILLPIVLIITGAAPFLGLVVAGWSGVVVGLVIGIVTFFSVFERSLRCEK